MVRIKHRYLLVNILYPGPDEDSSVNKSTFTHNKDLPWSIQFRQPTNDKFNAKTLLLLVRRGVEEAFGDYGSGMVSGSLVVKYFSPATSTAIIRVARAHFRLVWAALSYITTLPTGQACVFQIVRVSGTIRKSEEAAIRLAREAILKAQGDAVRVIGLPSEPIERQQQQQPATSDSILDDDDDDDEDDDGMQMDEG